MASKLSIRIWKTTIGFEAGLFSKVGLHSLRESPTHEGAHAEAETIRATTPGTPITCEAPGCAG